MTFKATDPILLLEADQPSSSDIFRWSLFKLKGAATELGIRSYDLTRDRVANRVHAPDIIQYIEAPVIAYGSIQFIRALKVPHVAYGWTGTDWASTSANIPRQLLLNSDHVMTTWGDLSDNFHYWLERIDPLGLFVRPNSDKKIFAGIPIPRKDFEHVINATNQTTSVQRDTICVLSSIKKIHAEYRFFIVDRKVVASSSYYSNWQPMSLQSKPPEDAVRMAEIVSQLDWQPDSAYTVDVAVLGDNSSRIVELNSFCCSGFYHSDTTAILKAVVSQAIRDFNP